MKSEFTLAFNQICAQYSLPREIVLEAVRAALVTAYRRGWKVSPLQTITAEVSLDTGLASIYMEKNVVETVEDPDLEISLTDARRIRPGAQVNDVIVLEVTPDNFGRIAAQTAKQVVMQRLREAERESQFTRYSRQEGEVIVGMVQAIKPHGIILHLEHTEEALLLKREQIPGERYALHQKIRVYVYQVRRTPREPEIIVSRSHPDMLRRLLELKVPEVHNGQVIVKAIAREAGARAKVAVASRQIGLDPVGACVGIRGIRIQTISRELHGERIDVIEWHESPEQFIANALSLNVFSVVLDPLIPDNKTASVVVKDDQLSLAIGKAGQNARLAAKLTGWRIDIQGVTEAALWTLEQVNTNPELLDDLKDIAHLLPNLASIMRIHEEDHYPYTDEELTIIKKMLEAVRGTIIARRRLAMDTDTRQARHRRSAQEQALLERQEALEKARAQVPEAAYHQAIDTLNLSDKVLGHLRRNDVETIGEVMEKVLLGDEDLLMLDGIGSKSLTEIKRAIEESKVSMDGEVTEDVVVPEDTPLTQEAMDAEQEETPIEQEPAEIETEAEETEASEELPAPATTTLEPSTAETTESQDIDTGIDTIAEWSGEVFEEEEEDIFDGHDKGKKKSKQKRRTIIYDEETGRTYAVHRRRNRQQWTDFNDDF